MHPIIKCTAKYVSATKEMVPSFKVKPHKCKKRKIEDDGEVVWDAFSAAIETGLQQVLNALQST